MSFFRKLFGLEPAEPTPSELAFVEAGQQLGLETKTGKFCSMYGTIDGHRVKVSWANGQRAEIDVRFASGLRKLDIGQRGRKVYVGRDDVLTGDEAFDALFVIADPSKSGVETPESVLAWLTPERKSELMALAESFDFDELEDDEFEVKIPAPAPGEAWHVEDLVTAVRICIAAAKVFEGSSA